MPSSAICERRSSNGAIVNHKNDINCVGVNNTHLDIVKQGCDDRSYCEVIKPNLLYPLLGRITKVIQVEANQHLLLRFLHETVFGHVCVWNFHGVQYIYLPHRSYSNAAMYVKFISGKASNDW